MKRKIEIVEILKNGKTQGYAPCIYVNKRQFMFKDNGEIKTFKTEKEARSYGKTVELPILE